MELKLKPYDKNIFPQGAILIKGASPQSWLKEMQAMKLSIASTMVYPLPGNVANSVWGCLVVGSFESSKVDIGRNTFCQSVSNLLFIPERSIIYPKISTDEVAKLLDNKLHFLHPEIGLVELAEAVDWKNVIQLPQMISREVKKPATTVSIPAQIKSFQVKAVTPEEALQTFEEKNFPQGQKFKDKPLNPFEKVKLFFYRQLFTKGNNQKEGFTEAPIERKPLLSKLEKLKNWLSKKDSSWTNNLQQDFEQLEKRNQKHLDRLLDMLKKNPAEALKYALPLDNDGTGRGGFGGSFNLEKRWFNFSLFDNLGGFNSSGGTAVLSGDSYGRLYQQYSETAKALIQQKEYRKAAFVYLKLLRDHNKAAQTLEEGGLYSEAAAVYLKHGNNKQKAAECFEKGSMYNDAIGLYKELNEDEKVGDLYMQLYRKKEAFLYYQKVVDNYIANHQYLKASQLYKSKMANDTNAQETLLKGWRLNRDAFNCLNNYFANIHDAQQLGEQLQVIYQKEVTPINREVFLRVLQHEYGKHQELMHPIREMAYELVVEEAKTNPSIVTELRTFNKEDKQLVKDTMRFKLNIKSSK